MLTVPVRTVRTFRTVTWKGRTIRTVMWQVDDVARFHWLIVVQSGVDTCLVDSEWYEGMWPNLWAPRVPRWLVYYCCVKTNGGRGVGPPDLPQHKPLQYSTNHYAARRSLSYMYLHIYLMYCIVLNEKGS
jgi:hypothetical protein